VALLSTVSASLVLGLMPVQSAPKRVLRPDEVFKDIGPRLMRLDSGGYAVLVGQKGLFLAHRSLVGDALVFGTSNEGTKYRLNLVTTDNSTQLCLIQADLWRDKTAPIAISNSKIDSGARIVAVSNGGPVAGELASSSRVGLIEPARRYMPLSEVRMETQQNRLAGAILFTERGELFGILSATLDLAPTADNMNQGKLVPQSPLTNNLSQNQKYGPGGITVTYSLSPSVISRVVDGFLSPNRKVSHPNLGVQFRDAANGAGVLVDSVSVGLQAEAAGLRPGDVITAIDNAPVTKATKFAAQLFDLKPGQKVTLTVNRAGAKKQITVEVGAVSLNENSNWTN